MIRMVTNNTKRRILVFSTAYYPFVGGAEVAVKEITDRLAPDLDFDLITARLDKKIPKFEKIGSVNVYRIGWGINTLDKLLLPFRGAILANRLSLKNKYLCMWGVMASFGSGAGYILNILRQLCGQKRIPMILNLQEGDSEEHLNYRWGGLIALSWKMALNHTDLLTGLSNFLLQRAKRVGYKGESLLIPNGVDLSVYNNKVTEVDKENLMKRLGKKEGDIFLITTSRLVYKNANDDVISSLVSLPKNVSFILIGKGDLGPQLQKQSKDLGVSDRVKFLGFIPNTDLPKYLSISDIFIRPSRSEGFGISFIEAMASGLPVVATPVGGIVDFVSDKETGVFCSPDNPNSIVVAVNTILNDKELRNKIVQNAQKMVFERYSWDKIAKDMKSQVFDRFLN